MIKLEHVTKNYNKFSAVKDVSFTVDAGCITALLGVNGAGKTSILKSIVGIHYPTSGRISVNGLSVTEWQLETKKMIGYVSEAPQFYNAFSVYEFLDFIASVRLQDLSFAQKTARIKDCAEKCAITDVLQKKIATLSKGYRQRLAFACAIMHEPSVLVLDEPVSGLDPVQIAEMRELILQFAKQKTVLLSTHLMQEVDALCEKVLILHKGILVAEGSAQSIMDKYGSASLEDAFLKICANEVNA